LHFIYNIGICLASIGLKLAALFSDKLKKGVLGRTSTFEILEKNISKQDKILWFHCASLGEYEQGLPVFTELRNQYKHHKIILSFFSPSGYEIRKNAPIADLVIYLPLDTKAHAKRFLDYLNPDLTVFVKYDIWPNVLNELKRRALRAILISAAFRKNQLYFKFYGTPFRKALFAFEHIFTQNETSKTLLESIGYNTVTVSGDTRFDRVYNQLNIDNTLDFIAEFKNNQLCVVAGSTWPDLQGRIHEKTAVFSEKSNKNLLDYKVFVIDTVGILSKIYSYADITYVGGAFGHTGLHNTLEPAVFSLPIIIGNNHEKFPEAKAMIEKGGLFEISQKDEFDAILSKLITDSDFRLKSGSKNLEYIKKNKGAVIQILDYLRK